MLQQSDQMRPGGSRQQGNGEMASITIKLTNNNILKQSAWLQHHLGQSRIMNSTSPVKGSKKITIFNYDLYIQSQDQIQYIHDLLITMLHKRKLDSAVLCMNQLNDILIQLQIPIKIKQLHELYLYATYQKFETKAQAKQRLLALMNNETRKIDVIAASKWIHENIKKANIKFGRTRAATSVQANLREDAKLEKEKKWRLPPIKGTSSEKLSEELKYLVEIFEQMEKERQNSGLIPINLQSDDQELDLTAANIPYDPELYELNKNLAKLRIKAEDRLARIIELARDQPRIRVKLEEAIEKFQRVRIEANQKVGRLGSMKAQKRLIQSKKKEENKLKNLKLGEQQNLLRAAKLYSLLSIQQRKPSKLIL